MIKDEESKKENNLGLIGNSTNTYPLLFK